MNNFLSLVIVSLTTGYIFGSIPNAVIIAKIKKVDIRKIGSGNPGAGNVAREIGKFWGILVFILDTAKAITPMLLADKVFHLNSFWVGITGLFAVIGHCYSIFLKFKGGKGAACSAGVMIYLFPKFSVIAIGTFFLLQKIPRTFKIFVPVFLTALGLWVWLYWNSMPLFLPFVLIFLTLGILLNLALIKELISRQSR